MCALLLGACAGSAVDEAGTARPDGGAAGATTIAEATTAAEVTSSTTTPTRGSDGCGSEPDLGPTTRPPGDVALSLEVEGRRWTYRLGIPETYDRGTPAPLVLALHGHGMDAEAMTAVTDLPARAGERGYITVAPEADQETSWALQAGAADERYLLTLLDDVAARYCIDLDRVHAAGLSQGAWKAIVTNCGHPGRFASIAAITVEVHIPDCPPTSIVAIHGTADPIAPYGEGGDPGIGATLEGLPGTRASIANWARGAGCLDDKDVTRIEPDVERWAYRGCPDGLSVELYTVEHGGHRWWGDGDTIDATEIALGFFDDHPAPGAER